VYYVYLSPFFFVFLFVHLVYYTFIHLSYYTLFHGFLQTPLRHKLKLWYNLTTHLINTNK